MIAEYLSGVSTLTLIIHLLDILLVWFLVYKLLSLLKGTRGMQLVKGILIVIGLKIFFNFIGFKTMTYIFEQVVTWGVLGIMIIFQPELRRALEYIGRVQLSNIFNINYKDVQKKSAEHIIKAVVDSSRHMARRRVGALIVLENNTGLDEYVESGITVNAEVTNELIVNIFIPNTPLHDGAMIIDENKIRAASCVLPLSDNRSIASSYGTRHRAALGLSEVTDAIVIAVSEETGKISVCQNGVLTSDFSTEDLTKYYVTAANGEAVPLSSIVSLELTTEPSSLPRMSQLNSATISGVVSGSIGDAVNWAKAELDRTLPQGYQYDFKSEARQYVQEGNAMVMTFGLAVIIIYLVLAIQFESWRDPMVILVSVPLAVSGALLVLNVLGIAKVAGATLNIYSQVGLVTLVGLITKHGILMCEVAKEEQLNNGLSRFEAIVHAATIRLRPIMMTTAAMVAGLIPLLLASGAGAIARFSIGIVIVAGLSIGTLFTLFVLPVIYTFLGQEHKPLREFDEEKYATQAVEKLDHSAN